MPWSNQGGGPWGGGGRGPNPWGRGPGGPQPPNIEELLKRSQERMRRVMPGGFGSGKGIALIAVLLVAAWVLLGGLYRVQPDEQGVELLFGKWVNTTGPGLHLWAPPPFGSVLTPKVTRINSMDIGFRGAPEGRGRARSVPEEALMLTGDENILDIQYTVFWQIKDAGQYLFNIYSPEATVKAAAESAMREVIGTVQAQFALAEGRPQIEQNTQNLLQRILDDYGAGILITQVQLRGVEPPQQVIDAFRDVQRAQADRERARNEAEAYRNDIVPRARGEAQRMIEEAEAYRQQVIAGAQGDAARFVSVYEAYRQAKDVTKQRLYIETMEEILRNATKIIVDQSAMSQGVVPYLPLNELQRRIPRPTANPEPAEPQQVITPRPAPAQQGGR
ncbi:MAG TPA: FtsH protease activity modulator HflK [Alphaproteobacteria bacterium]